MPPQAKQQNNHVSLMLVAFIVFIDMSGIGLIVPVLPSLIQSLDGGSVAHAAEIGGWLLFAYAVMQFMFAPVIGGLSDRYGRRPVLLITLFLLAIDYALMAWAPTLFWLFIGRVISGIMGASWTAANSCIADVTSAENKAKYFGMLGGAGAAGFVLGPAIGGILGQYNDRLPFMAACGLALIGVLIGYFKLQETLRPDKRRAFSITRANPFGNLVQMAKTPVVLGFLAVIFMLQLAAQTQIAVWTYYLIERFSWSELQIGLAITLFGICTAFMQGIATGSITARLGNAQAGFLSILFGFPAYLIIAFAPNGATVIVAIFWGALGAVAFPAMQAMMSSQISEDAQGELQGAIASAMGFTAIIGPIIMTVTFRIFADDTGLYFPGAPFILASVFSLIGLIIYARTTKRMALTPSN